VNRVVFLIDGFNVYHSIRQALEDGGGSLKWLDYQGLCRSYLSVFGREARVERVIYFSAYATHVQQTHPDVIVRHRRYVAALRGTGVETVMGRFKWHPRWCPTCQTEVPGYEEKETDVSIAVTLMELCLNDICDTAAIISGDTDLLPAIRAVKRLRSEKQIWVVFPYKRFNLELDQTADRTIKIKRAKYAKHQLPDPVTLSDGSVVAKPAGW
jgi:uncharacterized LabA/DUF88 family protein